MEQWATGHWERHLFQTLGYLEEHLIGSTLNLRLENKIRKFPQGEKIERTYQTEKKKKIEVKSLEAREHSKLEKLKEI